MCKLALLEVGEGDGIHPGCEKSVLVTKWNNLILC